jgi:hypothetical protein
MSAPATGTKIRRLSRYDASLPLDPTTATVASGNSIVAAPPDRPDRDVATGFIGGVSAGGTGAGSG